MKIWPSTVVNLKLAGGRKQTQVKLPTKMSSNNIFLDTIARNKTARKVKQ